MMSVMQAAKRFDRIFVLRAKSVDDENLRQLATRLDVSLSEAMRRALRVGMKVLTNVDFPGSSSAVKTRPVRKGAGVSE